MIESPVLQRLINEKIAEVSHELILSLLRGRFGLVPPRVKSLVTACTDKEVRNELNQLAAVSADLDAFCSHLASRTNSGGLDQRP